MTAFDTPWMDDRGRLLAITLAVVAALAMARILLRQWRASPQRRSTALRVALLLLAQPILAALLYAALLPPRTGDAVDTLVIATAGTTPKAWAAAPGSLRIALPEARALPGVQRMPDLATALRRHPEVRRLHVVGLGLEARDRDVAATRPLAFDAEPLPRGLVELDAPARAVAGAAFAVSARVNGVAGGTVELLDPASRRIDQVAFTGDGRFRVDAPVPVPGAATFQLRIHDAARRTVETLNVPVAVEADPPPRLLVLAGAPGPEVKFLRRWARDAGLPIHTQIDTGGGLQLGDVPLRLDAATFARFDAVVLDERAWSAMGEGGRAALVAALRDGLGVVLRVTSTLDDASRRRLRALGFEIATGDRDEPVRLLPPPRDEAAVRARLGPGTRDAPRRADDPLPDVPMLTRRATRLTAPDGRPLDSATAGVTTGLWRAEGRGRIAVWTLTDTYTLALAGRDDLHGAAWSDGIATVARPRPAGTFTVSGEARIGQRIALCGATGGDVIAPDGAAVPLRVDPRTGARACAAYWPRIPGRHEVRIGSKRYGFFVRNVAEAPGLHAAAAQEATSKLRASGTTPSETRITAAPRPAGSRTPWWLALLAVSAFVWWFERSRFGRRV